MQLLSDLRKEYAKFSLDAATVLADPIEQFQKWFDESLKADIPEPNAMTLATVNDMGRPSSRIVLLKGIESKQFLFYTNYLSKKGKELENNPACALTFLARTRAPDSNRRDRGSRGRTHVGCILQKQTPRITARSMGFTSKLRDQRKEIT